MGVNLMCKKTCVTLLFALHASTVLGEILDVNISWNSYQCVQNCPQILYRNFSQIRGVAEVNISSTAGAARLRWKPGFPFSYSMVKVPMQMAGVGVNEIRVRVRGQVLEQGRETVLISEGDNTRFVLVSPIMPSRRLYTTTPNPYYRELSPDLRDRIIRESEQGKLLVVEGPLFRPARSPPLQIIVQNIRVERPPEDRPTRGGRRPLAPLAPAP